ncbi:MAG: gamma-glutamyltransferase [Chloroflexota bacterium]|nr:gamma-glutamyltransferase [Chloroflexota bacterium]
MQGTERTTKAAVATNGMVATPHELATRAGIDALRDGGSAVDAVVAANAVLTVVYPDQTSVGGDCFLLYFDAAGGVLRGYNGAGRAPAAIDRAALRAAGHRQMPTRGILSVTVPGTVEAWAAASARFGRLGLDRLLRPAIGLARNGYQVSPALARRLLAAASVLDGADELRSRFSPGGVALRAGDRIRWPELVETLETIARDGADGFYRGRIGESIVATSERLGGYLTADDLARHRGEWVEPLTTDYRGTTVVALPPNSQGLTALLALNLVAPSAVPTAWGSAEHLHPWIEAKKIAFAVRDGMLSDPGFVPVDTDRLLSREFAADLWRAYDPARAAAGTPSLPGDTVYLCAVDRDGNAASLIQSIYMAFGSGVVAGGTGVVLQNRGSYFSLADDHPNRLEGGKRTLHTLMPGMLLRDGRLLGPFGTQGGDAQAQVQTQLVANVVDHGLDPQAAIDAPRWIAGGATPTAVALESRFPAATFTGLAARGHDVAAAGEWDAGFGHAQMILIDEERGVLLGGADPRADGVAFGL